jgi:membrane-associated phospholipid phosphatase
MTTYDQPPAESPAEAPSRSAARLYALVVAVLCAVGVWLVQQVAVQTSAGQRLDDRLLDILTALTGAAGDARADRFSEAAFGAAIIVALAIGLYALVQLRPDRLAVVAITVGGANLATQVLKHVVIDRPTLIEAAPNSLPSGHVTMVGSVALMLVVLSSGVVRVLLAVFGALVTFAVAASVVLAGWHRPSDVVAAVLVCCCFAALAVVAVGPDSRAEDWA